MKFRLPAVAVAALHAPIPPDGDVRARLPPRPGAWRGAAGFTIIELLIVIGLLGALAVLLLPSFSVSKEWAEESIALKEMMDIRRAYSAFEADCLPMVADHARIAAYGLEILMRAPLQTAASGWDFPASFDPERGKGWRGKYVESEAVLRINHLAPGQEKVAAGGVEVAAVLDPAGNHYRVLGYNGNRGLALVCVGKNGVLDASAVTGLASDAPFEDFFPENSCGDDIVRTLTLR